MRSCVVVGAGIVGLTTAYFLAKDGVNVTVIESQAEPVQGSSKGTLIA
jgi:D-amino-acid dehydrogenase